MRILPSLALLALAPAALAQRPMAEGKLYVRTVEEHVQAAIRVEIEDHWHLYHEDLGPEDAIGKPTTVELSGADLEWSRVVFPEPIRYEQEFGEAGEPTWINGHEGTIYLYAVAPAVPGADLASLRAKVEGLTCEEGGVCILYGEELASRGEGSERTWKRFPEALLASASGSAPPVENGAEVEAAKPEPTQKRTPVGRTASVKQSSLGAFLALAVFWGFFTLLMPCTYPMIPITISFFTKQSDESPSRQLALSITYGLGIVAIFILIGVIFGAAIIQFATHPVTNIVIGLLFVVFALALFGAINLQPPAFLMSAAGKASMKGGYVGVFLMGATLVVTSFTCTAPFVGSLLSVGAVDGSLTRIVLGMGTFGLTMAVPFVILSMVPRKISSMPKSGEWMHVLKVFLGFLELAAALKFFSNADLVWQWGILSRELFLLLWMGIFFIAAAFLFGMIRLKGESQAEIGPGRLVAATGTVLFALYCGYGFMGNDLDNVMTAIAPNYSGRKALGGGGGAVAKARDHVIVKDDYDLALATAKEEGKALLVNFTGHT